jgi:3-dehydroquinate dehydratase / shikimate dehydrogenase
MYLRTRRDCVYLPFHIPNGQLAEGLAAFDAVPVEGYGVTIPHKEAAATLATEAESFVRTCGAANTLVRKPEGGYFAANTDQAAVVAAIQDHLREIAGDAAPMELPQLGVLVLGSGGVARAIAHGLHREGAQLTLAARNYDKAAALAREVNCKVVDWHARHSVHCEIIINGTPVGMHPNVNESPLHPSCLRPGMIVFDTVYTPETTLLVREARNRGCSIITGVDMFVRQAARQFEHFIGITPDLDKMRDIMRKALSPLTKVLEDEAAAASDPA